MSEVFYKWIVGKTDDGSMLIASNWEGTVVELLNPKRYVDIRPDVEFGKPVMRRIGNGSLATHYRFELSGDREDAA